MHFSSFWRGDNLLGHLDRWTSLGEALEPLESVVDENPVLVRLTGVVIRGSRDFEINFGEVVKVGGVVNRLYLHRDGCWSLSNVRPVDPLKKVFNHQMYSIDPP